MFWLNLVFLSSLSFFYLSIMYNSEEFTEGF